MNGPVIGLIAAFVVLVAATFLPEDREEQPSSERHEAIYEAERQAHQQLDAIRMATRQALHDAVRAAAATEARSGREPD